MAFSTNGTSGDNGVSSEINVTPLIDVLLVMLIIFMVIMPEMPRGLNSALPSPASRGAVDEVPGRPIFVEVKSGLTTVRYVVDGADVGQEELASSLGSCYRRDIGSTGASQGGCELGFRGDCRRDQCGSGCRSGERRTGDSSN